MSLQFTIKGQLEPVVMIPAQEWDNTTGYTSHYVAFGLYDTLLAVTAQLRTMGCKRYRLDPDQLPRWKLSAEFAGATPETAARPSNPEAEITTVYAFPRNDLQRDIWAHPRVEAQLRKMDTVYRARFRSDVESWIRGETQISYTDPTGKESVVTLSRAGLLTVAQKFGADTAELGLFFDDLAAGIDSYIYSRRVLRVTMGGPTRSSLGQARSNTNRVYSRSAALSEIQPPDWVATKMPDGYWFKHEAEEQQSGTKLEIVQEWEYFGTIYSQFAYGAPL